MRIEGEDAVHRAHVDKRALRTQTGIAVAAAVAIGEQAVRPGDAGLEQPHRFVGADDAGGCRKGPAEAFQPRRHQNVAAAISIAPKRMNSWLRQSLMMNTTGSSYMWSRRARIQTRMVR